MKLLAICCLHLVHNDARKGGSPSLQQRFLAYGLNNVLHEGPISDEVKGLVWEVQGLSLTLRGLKKKKNLIKCLLKD